MKAVSTKSSVVFASTIPDTFDVCVCAHCLLRPFVYFCVKSPTSFAFAPQKATSNSAALGSAYRARHAVLGGEDALSFPEAMAQAGGRDESDQVCTPHKDAASV